jgi:hypothetical protein
MNQLSGNIPSEIGSCSQLLDFFANNNQLEGQIPSSIGNLAKLEKLSLEENQLNGNTPAELGNCSKLISLYLQRNYLSGNIPESLYNLLNLEVFSLYFNELTGGISPNVGRLSKLEVFYVDGNQLTGNFPAELGSITGIKKIFVDNNQLSGSIPSSIGNLVNLEKLYINTNQFSGDFPPIPNLTKLTHLGLNNNKLVNLPDLSMHKNRLVEASVQNNKFTFEDLEVNTQIASLYYEPQDTSINISISDLGNELMFTTSIGGIHNIYTWYKNREEQQGQNTAAFTISKSSITDGDEISVVVSNTKATALTFRKDTIIGRLPASLNKNLAKPKFKLYPNPANNELHVSVENEFENAPYIVQILDLSGRPIIVHSNAKDINISNLSSGTYILQIQTQNYLLNTKFVKQ